MESGANSAEVRAYPDELIVQRPDLFERMALGEIRGFRHRLQEGEALSIAYDAVLAVVRTAAGSPVRLDTILGLVRTYTHWAALDRLRGLGPRQEFAAGIGRELLGSAAGDRDELAVHLARAEDGGDPVEDLRAAASLRVLERIATRLRTRVPDAILNGRLRLSAGQVIAIREAGGAGSAGPARSDPATRKRLERARAAIIDWARSETTDEEELRLIDLLQGAGRPERERRRRVPELVRVLGLDQAVATTDNVDTGDADGASTIARPARATAGLLEESYT